MKNEALAKAKAMREQAEMIRAKTQGKVEEIKAKKAEVDSKIEIGKMKAMANRPKPRKAN